MANDPLGHGQGLSRLECNWVFPASPHIEQTIFYSGISWRGQAR